MSRICGMVFFNNAPVISTELNLMLKEMHPTFCDRSAVWVKENVGLGNNLLFNTPESVNEYQPFSSDRFVITADCRLDNREELGKMLSFTNNQLMIIPDSQLILNTYEKWGKDGIEKLRGDFAFAIWDKTEKTIFLCRDHLGVKPLYYYHSPTISFAFASEIKALLKLAWIPQNINESKVASYLIKINDNIPIEPETFFKNIYRLPPAAHLTINNTGHKLQTYWQLASTKNPDLKKDEDYVDYFGEIFNEAVRSRSKSIYPVSATLSGGLDSSAVCCMFNKTTHGMPLHTIYADCKHETSDEKAYVNHVLKGKDFKHNNIHVLSTLEAAKIATPLVDRPIYMPSPSVFLASIMAAQANKSRVLLTGHEGDSVLSYGNEYFIQLLKEKRYSLLNQTAHLSIENNIPGNSPFLSKEKMIKAFAYPRILSLLKSYWKNFKFYHYGELLFQANRFFDFTIKNNVGIICKSTVIPANRKWKSINPLIDPSFACHLKLNEQLKELDQYELRNRTSPYLAHINAITSNGILNLNEQLDHMGAAYGIETRHPFLDKRIAEICVSSPLRLKFNQGYGRGLLRKSMKHVLPQAIQYRKDKIDFHGSILKDYDTDKISMEKILNQNDHLYHYLSKSSTKKTYQRFKNSDSDSIEKRYDHRILLRAVYLSIWLDKDETQQV